MEIKIKREVLIVIALLSLLIVGASGCELPGSGTTSSKNGLDFSLVSGFDKISSGKVINLGDSMKVHIKIENYDKKERSGEICIRDDLDDAYGGITSQCSPFLVGEAEVTGASGGFFGATEQVQPGTTEILLPTGGEFVYTGLPVTQTANIYITASYEQESRIEAPNGVAVPSPEVETVQLSQDPAPITASIEKSISRQQDAYKLNLGITLTKQQAVEVFSPGFGKKGVLSFKADMFTKTLICEPSGSYDPQLFTQGLVEIESKKFINCFTLVDATEQTTWPLRLDVNYGVKLEKSFQFTIQVEK